MNLQKVFLEQGQSPWLDNLQRGYLNSGKLQDLVTNGVRGLTSNPTIFQKAIQGSNDYDAQFKKLIQSGMSVRDAYWEMVLTDIHGALDIFDPLYRESNGSDGFVSVEVDPSLAHDAIATLNAARELHERVNRPNVMIKIPATQEGLPAIQTMIAEGRNVNVTLIFGLDRYEQVIDAYINGLLQRVDAGLSVTGIESVASFFISRVDAEVDKQLVAIGTDAAIQLQGKAAISQAKLAYKLFSEKFSSAEWKKLESHGASVQRPLWASTSTKNPAYPDTLYVDELIGAHTVNTLPDATLEAFADHGTVNRTIDRNIDQAETVWKQLHDVGIDMAAVSSQLETEGVASFIASFDDLIGTLEQKKKSLH